METATNVPLANEELLNRPIWQMTGSEFLTLVKMAGLEDPEKSKPKERNLVYGLQELADNLHCGRSTVSNLRHQGILDPAIYSNLGNTLVIDLDIARKQVTDMHNNRIKRNSKK